MQHIHYRIVSLIVFVLCSFTAMAQRDTMYKSYKDTFYKYKLEKKQLDSFHKKINIERQNYQVHVFKRDSLKRFDSLRSNFKRFPKMRTDSAFKRLYAERKKLHMQNRLRTDSAFSRLKMDRTYLTALGSYKMTDSGYKKFKLDKLQQLDVREKYLKNLRFDSVRMKQYIRYKKDSAYYKLDSLQRGKKYSTKEISMQISCKPGEMIFIKNADRKIIVKKGNSGQVGISMTINYAEDERYSDAAWFKRLNADFVRTDSGIVADVRYMHTNFLSGANQKRTMTIEIPEHVSLNIATSNAEMQLENNVERLTANISNGTLKMQSGNEISITGKYSTIKAEVFKQANISLTNCRFSASNIGELTIDSKYSTVNINDTKSIVITSTGDQYNVDGAYAVTGKKNFGKFNIATLNGDVDLTGASTDVKINTMNDNVSFIKIDSKYADLRFPIYDLKAYEIKYEGSSKSVSNVYTENQKGSGTATITVSQNVGADTTKNAGKVNRTLFEASAGNTNGKHTKADIKCAFCNVVFQ